MALKISLKPGERFVVNGAVITNGDRRSSFVINNKVSILRERDIMTEDEITTPARRVYFPIMLSYLEPARAGDYQEEFMLRMTELLGALLNQQMRMQCVQVSMDMMNKEYYRALAGCRKIVEYEQTVLTPPLAGAADGSGSVSTRPESNGIAA